MVQAKLDRLQETCEKLGWKFTHDKKNGTIELRKYSPAGEDFGFTVSDKNPIKEILEAYCSFDIEEHVEDWLDAKLKGVSGVPDVVTLVDDAKEISNMLEELKDKCCDLKLEFESWGDEDVPD